jgi:hypothetical protein
MFYLRSEVQFWTKLKRQSKRRSNNYVSGIIKKKICLWFLSIFWPFYHKCDCGQAYPPHHWPVGYIHIKCWTSALKCNLPAIQGNQDGGRVWKRWIGLRTDHSQTWQKMALKSWNKCFIVKDNMHNYYRDTLFKRDCFVVISSKIYCFCVNEFPCMVKTFLQVTLKIKYGGSKRCIIQLAVVNGALFNGGSKRCIDGALFNGSVWYKL